MRPRATTSAVVLATLAALTSAHSWVEEVHRVAADGSLVGEVGYPRGWIARTSTNPVWKDAIPQWLLPLSGQSAYSGDEVLNKYDYDPQPKFPMLKASPGDHVSLIHLENGHTTLPQNQPLKPRNRGTVFLYGTSNPKPKERLFDVHLVWNRDGTGGDKRGILLGTRNYDDGQCYQPNQGEISLSRASKLASDGAVHDRELRCQSNIQLPNDLKPGSTYTIYWYWDWPDLNAAKINMDATANGIYPWAGTFMRGEKDPHGFTMSAIARNESYASTVDIQIVGKSQMGAVAKVAAAVGAAPGQDQNNVYNMAIKNQLGSNFQVDIDANKPAPAGSGDANNGGQVPSGAPTSQPGAGQSGGVTVTMTVTVPPSTVISTVYITKPTDSTAAQSSAAPSSATQSSALSSRPARPTKPDVYATVTMSPSVAMPTTMSTVTQTSTVTSTVTQTVHDGPAGTGNLPTSEAVSPTPRARAVRRNWRYAA